MVGGAAACHSYAKALLDAAGVVAGEGAVSLDLGAGGGYHARALAERGFEVIAVDSSVTLLQELTESCAGFGVTPVQGNLLDDGLYRRRAPFALILCVGDTVTHLSTRADAERLIDQCAELLVQGGRLVVQFREQAGDMPPESCTFTTRA